MIATAATGIDGEDRLRAGIVGLLEPSWTRLPLAARKQIQTVGYLLTAIFFLPETKGKTLEEIEGYFEGGK